MAKTGQVEKLVEAPSTSAKWHQVIKTLSFIFKTSAVRPWRTQEKIKGKRKLVRYIFFGGISYLRLLVIWAIFSKKRNSLELFFFNSMRCSRQSFSCLLIMCFDFFPCLHRVIWTRSGDENSRRFCISFKNYLLPPNIQMTLFWLGKGALFPQEILL